MAIFDEFPYTNFHDKNLDGMCKAIGKNHEDIDKNTEQITILKGRMQIAEQQIDQHANQIANLSGRMVTAENDIDNHEDRITELEHGGGGGGGGFTWGTAELILQGGQRVPIKYNFDAGFFIIPDTSSLACGYYNSNVTNPVTGIEFITGGGGTVPMTFHLKYVIPMCTDDIGVAGGQYFTVSAQWTIKFNGGTAESCRCNPVTYSALSGSLIRGQIVTFPIFGVCY